MDDLNEIKTALEAKIAGLKAEMGRYLLALEERISTLEAQRDEAENAHERALELRNQDIARLQEQLRDNDTARCDFEREIRHLKSEVERTRRGW